MYYCAECGLVRFIDELEQSYCAYCKKDCEFIKLKLSDLKMGRKDEVNHKLASVYRLFTTGEIKDVDFLFEE